MIVVGGEALVDLVPDPSTTDAALAALWPRRGGGPYNVALTIGRLGMPASFLSRVSTDGFGDALVRGLHEAGVSTELLDRGPEPTTLAVVTLDEAGAARYTFYIEGTADRLFGDPGALPSAATMLSLGTLGMVLEPGASAYEAVLRRAASAGMLTALDPNVRADLISDPATYRARFESWLPDTRLLKLSVEDAAWLAGMPGAGADETASAVRGWLRRGPSAVVLTHGGAGITAFTAGGDVVSVPAPETTVADTIGAGDTVQGALLAWLYENGCAAPERLARMDTGRWQHALEFASAAAAITVSREGAEPPVRAEVDELLVR